MQAAGIDLLWFGIYMVLVVEMAQITPPVGFNLFVVQSLTGRDILFVARATLPFFAMMLVARAAGDVPRRRHLASGADDVNRRRAFARVR